MVEILNNINIQQIKKYYIQFQRLPIVCSLLLYHLLNNELSLGSYYIVIIYIIKNTA